MNMIQSRNQTSHSYDSELAGMIVSEVIHTYYPQFKILLGDFKIKYGAE